MTDVLDFGEVVIPYLSGRWPLYEVNYVRTWIRKHRYGEVDKPSDYRVLVTRMNGAVEEWTFTPSVGWPLVDGVEVDWDSQWLETE